MFQSLRYSNLSLRIALCFLFLWFGIDKFIHPTYWANAWLPSSIANISQTLGLSSIDLMYLIGILEVLTAFSFLLNIFVEVFAILAILLLGGSVAFYGFNEITARNIAIIGSLIALVIWPRNRFR